MQGEKQAERYAKRFERGSRKRIDRREQRAVRKIFLGLPECQTVLDVPCGAGRFVKTLAQGGRTVIELDVAFEILLHALERARNARARAVTVGGDASRLPLRTEAVDCVFCNRLLHHIHSSHERTAILREFHRVCRRWLVISFFNYKGLAGIRRLLKQLKGRTPPYQNQPTMEEFNHELSASGFRVKAMVSTGPFWVSQKYFVLEKE
jgi:ubiquinone/menaquinone biosynthesis C-methylase UbiE